MKVLLITPNFFDYPKQICDEIRSMGHEVDWFDDRPSTNSFIKAVIRIKKDVINFIIRRYFNEVMNIVKEKKYDKVLLISGQSLSFNEKMIMTIRKTQPQAEFVLYQWDSVKNFPYIESLQKLFDRCYSFDRKDVSENEKLKFLPLFYNRKYAAIGTRPVAKYKYDFMFVGTAHPKKYKFVREMSKKLSSTYKNQFVYFYFPSRLVYIFRKFKNPELKNARYSEFHFTPIKGKEMDDLLYESRCVLDSAQGGQTGLTIRVLESLGAKRKIITTNQDVVNYDFYRPKNIYVYEGKFDFNDIFFNSEYQDVEKDVYEKYSLNSWLKELLEGTMSK